MIETIIIISLALLLSLIVNTILFLYLRKVVVRIFIASEQAAEMFSYLDAYKEHLISVYEMPTFNGDETLKSLLEHTREMSEYLKRYDEVYSFTQPDLEEQLLEATREAEEEYDKDEEETSSEEEE
jgi:hypothetical protein